jgi:GcrA cell cycle regulator
MEWTEDTIVRLRGLWAEGHSTAEIGRRLGVSKNAVVGKAHRLDLPARPSPIRRDGGEGIAMRRPPARRVAGPTLPPLSSGNAAQAVPAPVTAQQPLAPRLTSQPEPGPVAAVRVVPPVAAPAPRVQAVPRPYARTLTCCWPIGEPGTKSFRFCDAEASSGKPYCATHAALAYVKVRDRREDAA